MSGLHAACFVAGGICVVGAALVAALLPSRPGLTAVAASVPSQMSTAEPVASSVTV